MKHKESKEDPEWHKPSAWVVLLPISSFSISVTDSGIFHNMIGYFGFRRIVSFDQLETNMKSYLKKVQVIDVVD